MYEKPNLKINLNGRITIYNYNRDKKYKLQTNKKINVDVEKLFSTMDIIEKSKWADKSVTKLDYPIDLVTLEEYINIISTNIMDDSVDNLYKNEAILLKFIQFIEENLGKECKIIFTNKSLNNLLRKINKLPSVDEKFDITYLYDGINFYVYNPTDKEMAFLFPIKKTDMYQIFNSNKDNFENELLVQFFEEIYGTLENNNPFVK